MLDHEKLDVYRCSIEHLSFVYESLPNVPRGFASLADQWRRAATSIPLNIAEAVGKPSAPDRANKFAIARGEAMDCGAILDVIQLLGCVEPARAAQAKSVLVRVVEMLSKLCR